MNDLVFRSATDVAAMVRRKAISRELTEAVLDRVEAVHPALVHVLSA